ncbi:MAG TPA: hypothetical protein VNM48_21570 [Chloroflexota bacterium]|nr:hypothetical protein [Chloroflexota bacterium]
MAADAMFPKPTSPAGRVLAHLVSSDVPGTPIETTLAAVAESTKLEKDDARRALAQLEKDGFILTEPGDAEASDVLTVTVLLAPPLEDYGITPRWGESTSAAPTSLASPTRSAMSETSEEPARAAPKTAAKLATKPAAALAPAAPAAPAVPPVATAKAASKTTQRAAKATAVDETAVLRGFVERFEHMLTELEEWKKRALNAEQQIGSIEKLLRSAERRAETAEQQLAASQERTQSWTDLTRRMQELARKAEASTRRPTKG